MPRKPRFFSPTGIYHIILRSVNQHIIFEEDYDYQKFLYILSDCKTKYDVDIFAYCLMDNHIHILLYSLPKNLPNFFQSLGSQFVHWYNNKYSRTGHLFQDRYHSRAVLDETAYLATLNYIHNNPIKAHICRYPSEYRWSSYNAFYGAKNPLVNIDFSYSIAGSKKTLMRRFAYESDTDSTYFHEDHHEPAHYMTDEEAISYFKSFTNLSCTSDVTKLPQKERNQLVYSLYKSGLTQKQISRLFDISIVTVKRICKKYS